MGERESEIVIRLRKELAEFSRRAFQRGLVSGAGGNISVRIPHTDTVLITPTGISLADIDPEINLLVNLAGEIIESPFGLKPSKECSFHLVVYQLRPSHPTRWGHWAAGRWLAEHAGPSDVVLDTRGWARFISGAAGYDYWHVRQALTDSHLSYVVVGHEELESRSPRARTLNALLTFAATPVQDFPAFAGDRDVGVRIYRFYRPGSWEGLIP